MKKRKGGARGTNAHVERIVHIAGLVVPITLLLYGALIVFDVIKNNHHFNHLLFAIIGILWIALSIYQFFVPSRSRVESIIRIIAYHVLASLHILAVTGLDMPLTGAWIVLFLASYVYFGRRGLNLSIFVLFGVTVIDCALHIHNAEYIIRSGLYFLGTILVGSIAGIVTASGEVDRRELSRSQAQELLQRDRILTIVNNLADGILSTDKDSIIQVYNAASLNLLDTNRELAGQPIDSVIRLIDKNNKPFRFSKAFRAARSVETREDLSTTISDETIHLSVIYSPIHSTNSHNQGMSDGYVVILRDITKQKSLEEERDEFISVVSHELRTPITIAEGSLSNVQLMMDRDDIPKSTLSASIKASHDQVLFLAKMVNDLSTLSRAERGIGDTVEEINISELIHSLYNEYAPEAEAKGLRFNLDLSPQLGSVMASRLYLKELLQNLVTNAIKYTKKGEVTVEVKKRNSKLQFNIHDSGIGISKSDQKHIYDKFWRSEDYRTRETGGTGLGLYVSAKLAKKLDTQIELSSRLNHGSTFGFSLETK